MPMNLPVSGKVCSKVRVPVGYFLGSTWVMVTGSRTCGLPSSASVRNGSPFIVVWFPSSLMRRISVSMSRSSGSCISSATTICPMLGISSQNSSREFCGWYPVKNMMSGPIRKTHLLSTMPTPPCACAAEANRTMARSHPAIPRIIIVRIIIVLSSHNISPAGASAPAGEITFLVYLLQPTRDNVSDRHEGRDHRSADFHRVARSTRREEEQNAGERTVDVIGQTRKTFRIPPRVLDGDRDVLGLARRDGGIIAQRQAPVRQQIVRIFHLGGVDVRIQEAEACGV